MVTTMDRRRARQVRRRETDLTRGSGGSEVNPTDLEFDCSDPTPPHFLQGLRQASHPRAFEIRGRVFGELVIVCTKQYQSLTIHRFRTRQRERHTSPTWHDEETGMFRLHVIRSRRHTHARCRRVRGRVDIHITI